MSYGPDRSRNRRGGRESASRDPYDRRDARAGSREPRTSRRNDRDYDDDPEKSPSNSIKVSATSNVKLVAGKVAHSCRDGDPPAMLTIGATCVNQAVKAIAIARGYLSEDNWDVSFQPAFRDKDRNKPSVALYLAKQRPNRKSREDDVELPVSASSQPAVVAGALAARIREQKSVSLTGIGVDAVTNAVLAIGNARLYLEEDGLDIRAMPEFVKVQKNNMPLSAVSFHITAEAI